MLCGWHNIMPVMLDRIKYYKDGVEYSPEQIERQKKDVLYYIDAQLEFWNMVMPPQTLKIYTGDHGQMLGEYGHIGAGMTWHLDNIHVPLIFSGIEGEFNKVWSRKKFSDVFLSYLKTGEIHPESCEFAEAQRAALYDDKFLDKKYIKGLGKKYSGEWRLAVGENDKYVKYGSSGAEYTLKSDESVNLIKEPKYQERIKRMEAFLAT